MKQRLLVMNGQRIVQREDAGGWATQKVDKAGELKPAVYNIFTAAPPKYAQTYEGVVVHSDPTSVYQQIGKSFIVHDRSAFDKVPIVGKAISVAYDDAGKAVIAAMKPDELVRSRSR